MECHLAVLIPGDRVPLVPRCQDCQRSGDGGKLGNKSPVPAGQAQEGPRFLLCARWWTAAYRLNFVHLWSNLTSSQPVAPVFFLLLGPLTLGGIQGQAGLLDLAMDSLQVMQVLLPGVTEDDHVFQIGSTAVLTPP